MIQADGGEPGLVVEEAARVKHWGWREGVVCFIFPAILSKQCQAGI